MALTMVTKWCSLLVCIAAFQGVSVAGQTTTEDVIFTTIEEEVTSIIDTTIDVTESTTQDEPTTSVSPITTNVTYQTTNPFSSTISSTVQTEPLSTTSRPTIPPLPTTPPVSGPLPEPEYPDLDPAARKEVEIEISVLDYNSECYKDLESIECEDFLENVVSQVWDSYDTISGLNNITVIDYRNVATEGISILSTYVIVGHMVSFIWNDMSNSERGLSAQAIYDMTVASDIAKGKIGNLNVSATCEECKAPQEITELCNEAPSCNEAPPYFYGVCLDGKPICRSECLNSYCGKNGICTHNDEKPVCGCLHDSETLYFGEQCDLQLDKLWFIIGVSIGAFVVILLITILSVCLVITRRNKSNNNKQMKSPLPVEEELGMQNYGYTNEEYDPTQANGDGIVFHTTTGERPYSYLYTNGHADNRKSSFGSSIAQEAAQKQADKHKNSAFWGNLNDSGSSAGTGMQPMLMNLDTSQGYRIQRPKSISSSLPEPDYDA